MSYQLINLLDTILGPHQKHSHGEFYWSCPFCHHAKPKLAINVAKGAWHCWVCNASGKRLLSLFRKLSCSREQIAELSTILQEDIKYIQSDPIVANLALPKEYVPLYQPNNSISYRQAIRYVTARGITASDILRYQIGYCPDGLYANRIIVPSFDVDGKLNYFVGRSVYEDGMKYKNPPVSKNVIGFENSINWRYPIILCEGVYDAIAIKRNAIPLLGKTMPRKLAERIVTENVNRIYLALDADALRQTSQIAKDLMGDGREVFVVELDGKDPSELGFEHMSELIRSAKPLGFAELVKLRATA
jgi:DNA primase